VPLQAAPTPTPARPRVADAFGDFGRPTPDAVPTAGAVDIRKITPARPKPKEEAVKPAKPAPPSHPSRIWVQVAAGRNKDALAFDWRKMAREAPEQFRGKKANVSAFGQSNRLLAGPFPSEAAATTFITQLRRANVDGAFVWNSPAGQVVDALPTP
jgi:cell division septation protein DedD